MRKIELIEALKEKNVSISNKLKAKEILKIAKETKIVINKEMPTKVTGYIGKLVRIIDVLWRRRFLIPGKLIPDKTTCEALLKELEDFKNECCEVEMTMLKLNVLVQFTPKHTTRLQGRTLSIFGASLNYSLEKYVLH